MTRLPLASWFGLVAGMSLAFVMACASAHKASPSAAGASPSSDVPSPSMMPADPHAQITELAKQIELSRGKLGLPPAPVTMAACPGNQCSPAPEAMTTQADTTCHPAQSDTCTSSCTLSDSICDNASKICNLAKQLPGDAWASERCTSANASCHDAHDKCCACTQ